jgi:hypothetical protein
MSEKEHPNKNQFVQGKHAILSLFRFKRTKTFNDAQFKRHAVIPGIPLPSNPSAR